MSTVHFNNMMGMTGMCESITAPMSTIHMMENMLPKLYKNPEAGPCSAVTGSTPRCKEEGGMKVCVTTP